MQQIANFGIAGLEDRLIEACMTCLTYDPQCEAERAPWLFSLVEQAGLSTRVIQALGTLIQQPPPEDYRDMAQRSALLKEFAAGGAEEARRLLYSSLVRLTDSVDVIGADPIIELDGTAGLIHVARQLGRWLQADPGFWAHDLASQVEGGLAALEQHAESDPDVAAYLAGTSASDPRVAPPAKTWTASEIVSYVASRPRDSCHWLRSWGTNATSDECEVVFNALLATNDPEQARRLFRAFAKKGVPRFEPGLLPWVTHHDDRVQWAAIQALAPVSHGELRQLALRMISERKSLGFNLLVNNFEAGDFAWCMKHLPEPGEAEDDDIHHDLTSLLDQGKAHPGPEALGCLLHVYELSPCSTCRWQAVEAMVGSNTTPAWVLAEARFDAVPQTRALVPN